MEWNDTTRQLTLKGTSSQIAGKTRTFRVLHVGSGAEGTATCEYAGLR
jgi:hypothetical protein